MTKQYTLPGLGWRAFFQQQLSIDEVEQARPARVLTVQRSGITVGDTQGERHIALASKWFALPAEQRPAIGDWVLLSEQGDAVTRVLDRCSVFTRVTAGVKTDLQVIAANVDTLFVVTSCNEEFNASRLERYLALAIEAHVDAVVVLTKADLCDTADEYVRCRSRRTQERCDRMRERHGSDGDRRRACLVPSGPDCRAHRLVRCREVVAAQQPRR